MLIRNQKIGRNIFVLSGIILIALGLVKLQQRQLSQLDTLEEETNYLKEEEHLKTKVKLQQKMPVFGFDNLLADWTYSQFIQYFGDTEARNVTGYSVVTDYFETVVQFDPNFVKSHLVMSPANSLFAAEPEKTIKLLDKALETVKPEVTNYPFFLWTYKATDEILFLNDLEAAKNSYEMAAKWASKRDDKLGEEMASRYQASAKFLANNPDSSDAQIGAWVNVLNQATDAKTQERVINELEKLGVEITITEEGKITIKNNQQKRT